jgi:hypothetical protein
VAITLSADERAELVASMQREGHATLAAFIRWAALKKAREAS